MSKIFINTVRINTIITPMLNALILQLGDLTNNIDLNNIPSDFAYTSNLISVKQQIEYTLGNIIKKKNLIQNIAEKFDDAERKNEEMMYALDEMMKPFSEEDSLNHRLVTDLIYNLNNGNINSSNQLLFLNNNYEIAGTPQAFMAAVKQLDREQHDWSYGNLIYDTKPNTNKLTFDNGVINNPKKGTCCATFVASAMYCAGYITEDDLTFGKVFNPHYQVYLYKYVKDMGYQQIKDKDLLQPGDIVFYNFDEKGEPAHVDVYAGKDLTTGEILIYSAGTEEDIKHVGPLKAENYAFTDGYWKAYRLPDLSKSNTQENNENTTTS